MLSIGEPARRLLVFATAAVVVLASASPAIAKKKKKKRSRKKSKIGQVAADQKDPLRERLDAAIGLIKREEYPNAAVELESFLEEKAARVKYGDEARYQLGKALYRMEIYHSALGEFTKILRKGPKNRFYKSALEWCLFISRKVVANERVDEIISKNAATDFPTDYRNEFHFRMARHHYAQARAIEVGAIAGSLGETRVEESASGRKSFKGDIFGGEEDDFTEEPEDKEPGSVERTDEGGLSIGDDLFGLDEPEDKKKKKKKEKKQAPPPKPGAELSVKEHIAAAQRFVMRVDPKSEFGARAKFLEALVHFHQRGDDKSKGGEALDAFKSVVRLTRGAEEGTAEARLRELAFFQLARTHFGARQPSFSIFYYRKIDRDSYAWLDSLYEASWAEFRLGNYEKALGNLLTIHSPFFRDEYYPESLILKAVIYYENCRYTEAETILKAFLRRYEPVHEELTRLTARDLPAEKYYEILDNLRGKDLAESNAEKSELVSQILGIALSDDELRRLDGSYLEIDGEMKRIREVGGTFSASSLATRLEDSLGGVRKELSKSAGLAVKRKLEQERDTVKQLIEQAIRIDIETSKSEQERIESQLRKVQQAPADRENAYTEWADDEKLVWPFEGEYWRDELGTYELTLAHSCVNPKRGG